MTTEKTRVKNSKAIHNIRMHFVTFANKHYLTKQELLSLDSYTIQDQTCSKFDIETNRYERIHQIISTTDINSFHKDLDKNKIISEIKHPSDKSSEIVRTTLNDIARNRINSNDILTLKQNTEIESAFNIELKKHVNSRNLSKFEYVLNIGIGNNVFKPSHEKGIHIDHSLYSDIKRAIENSIKNNAKSDLTTLAKITKLLPKRNNYLDTNHSYIEKLIIAEYENPNNSKIKYKEAIKLLEVIGSKTQSVFPKTSCNIEKKDSGTLVDMCVQECSDPNDFLNNAHLSYIKRPLSRDVIKKETLSHNCYYVDKEGNLLSNSLKCACIFEDIKTDYGNTIFGTDIYYYSNSSTTPDNIGITTHIDCDCTSINYAPLANVKETKSPLVAPPHPSAIIDSTSDSDFYSYINIYENSGSNISQLESALAVILYRNDPNVESPELIIRQAKLIEVILENCENCESIEKLHRLPSPKVIKLLCKYLSPNHVLNLIVSAIDSSQNPEKIIHSIQLVLEESADIDAKSNFEFADRNFSILENLIFTVSNINLDNDAKYKIIDYAIDQSNVKAISCDCLVGSSCDSPTYAAGLLQKFPNTYDEEYVLSVGRARGASHLEVQTVINIFSLANDINEYRAITEDDSSTCSKSNINNDLNSGLPLTETEISILDPNIDPLSIAEYKGAMLNNKYGFTALHLSMFAQKYGLAATMIQAGFDSQATSSSGITPLHIFSAALADQTSKEYNTLVQCLLDRTDIDIDQSFADSGETLAHSFLSGTYSSDSKLQSAILDKTNDPLFVFSKKPSNLFAPYQHPEKIHIAISNGEGFWSTGSWSLANLMMQKHDDVELHLVSYNLIQNIPRQYREEFLNQFDGFINPGAGDTYPKHSFTKKDWKPQMDLEKLYHNVLDHSSKNGSPIVGMCAGTQHFALYHGGTIAPLKGYSNGQHTISFIEGSLPYFMMLSKEQQKQALLSCEFPKVEIKGDTAHHFAAVLHKLGDRIQLGGVSEDHIPMAYNHENGIRYGTQFHPEHYYKALSVDENVLGFFESNFFDNFIELARLKHAYKFNSQENLHPIDLVAMINNRLSECTLKPTCVTSIDLTGVDSSFYDDHNFDNTAA